MCKCMFAKAVQPLSLSLSSVEEEMRPSVALDAWPVVLSSGSQVVGRGSRHLNGDRDAGRDESGRGCGGCRCRRVGSRSSSELTGVQGLVVRDRLVSRGSASGRPVMVMPIGAEGEGVVGIRRSSWGKHAGVLAGLLLQTGVLQIAP